MENNHPAQRSRYDVSYRGLQTREGGASPVWRIELLDEKNEPTDIWSEVFLRPSNRMWVSTNGDKVYDNLAEALQHGFLSLLEYGGYDETGA